MLCEVCGMPVKSGMTDDEASFHVHDEECFRTYMNRTYGVGQWMALGNGLQDELGGYYIHTSDNDERGYEATGIYYTDFDD